MTQIEKEILKLLQGNGGGYHSEDTLFSDFLKAHKEYVSNQQSVRKAIKNCISKGYIAHDEYPDRWIHTTDEGRAAMENCAAD